MSTDIRRLYRSREDRMIGGVCGGLGEYLGIDPTVVRLLFVIAAFIGGSAILVYLVMLLVVPEEPLESVSTTAAAVEDDSKSKSAAMEKPKRVSKGRRSAQKKPASKSTE